MEVCERSIGVAEMRDGEAGVVRGAGWERPELPQTAGARGVGGDGLSP